MKKIDRRSFLQKAGVATAGLVAGIHLPVAASELVEQAGLAHLDSGSPSFFPPIEAQTFGETCSAYPIDHQCALVNPNMGWTLQFYSNMIENYGSKLAPSDTVEDFPGLGAVYFRLPWAFLEPEEGKFCWEIFDTPAQRWIDQGRQICFRVSAMESWLQLATPKWVFDAGSKSYSVDNDRLIEPDYGDPIFLEKVENFVQAFARRYDDNVNVAFVDIGHMGMWGEGHTVATSPKHGKEWGIEVLKQHIDLYCRHFKRTQLCISDDYAGPFLRGTDFPIMDYALSKGVTMRDDSILVSKPPEHWYHAQMAQRFWPTMPVILEHEHYGLSLKRGNWNSDLLVQSVEEYHASYMSIHWWPREQLEGTREAVDRINRRIGYRLRMSRAQWPRELIIGEEFVIESEWSNAGVAPCYQGGFPCFTLKDKQGGIVSVLVDESLDVKTLVVSSPEEEKVQSLISKFTIAPAFYSQNYEYARAVNNGELLLYFSVGKRDGTPLYHLPYGGDDGKKRYQLGQLSLVGERPEKLIRPY